MLIGYTRYSPEHKGRQDRITGQVQADRIRAYGVAHDLEIGEIVADQDESGKDMDRPGWLRVVAALESGEASGIVVYKLDRMTRSLRDLLQLMAEFSGRGWALHAVADKVDTDTATGRLVVHILGALSQWERETIAERTSAALQHKMAAGAHIGAVPYGWRRAKGPDGKMTRLEEVPEEQYVIGMIRNCRIQDGMSDESIADYLNRQGRTRASGKPWNRQAVERVLARQS